jgi:ribonuclease HI
MGVGWLGIDRIENSVVSLGNLKVVNWPSSTKAELIGIWIVLLISQCNKTIRVLTDSEQAIDCINKAGEVNQYSKWIRSDNRIILERIISLARQKSLNLELEKVKSHSGDKWNDEADRLAKEGKSASTVLNLGDIKNDNIEYEITWKSNRIENSVKCFISKLNKRYIDAEWVYARKDNLEEGTKYNWKRLWQGIKKQRGINCLSLKDSKNLILQVKCLSNNLPTLSELKKRKPEVYKSDHCILCKKGLSEDLDHLMSCSALQESWKEIEEAAVQVIGKIQGEEDNLYFLQKVNKIVFPEEEKLRFQRRLDLIIGLEENSMIEDLISLAGEEKEAKLWLNSILFMVQRSFAEVIWNFRCEKVILWERKEGISFKEKRSSSKEKRRKLRTQTSEEKKALLSKRKKERERKKVGIRKLVDDAVESVIYKGIGEWWSLL